MALVLAVPPLEAGVLTQTLVATGLHRGVVQCHRHIGEIIPVVLLDAHPPGGKG